MAAQFSIGHAAASPYELIMLPAISFCPVIFDNTLPVHAKPEIIFIAF
jgi:hypothetical protein